MSLDQIMNEGGIDPEIIGIRNTLLADKLENELVKSYFKVKNELCEHNESILLSSRIRRTHFLTKIFLSPSLKNCKCRAPRN